MLSSGEKNYESQSVEYRAGADARRDFHPFVHFRRDCAGCAATQHETGWNRRHRHFCDRGVATRGRSHRLCKRQTHAAAHRHQFFRGIGAGGSDRRTGLPGSGESGSFICSASLIKKGVVVTAAHCISEFGKNKFWTNWRFVPGYKSGAAPYGNWMAKTTIVQVSYLNGTNPCATSTAPPGVICRDDVAVVVLNPQSGKLPGSNTGWFGYAYNSAGFTPSGQVHLTQLGYPGCLDNGEIMARNDSQGFKSSSQANNTLLGSLMCGGSSGGPWLINFGRRPTLSGTTSGSSSQINTVVGVTSWGSANNGPKQQGASPFLSTNIQAMVNAACNSNPAHCAN